uniref:Uncharacterized protein n=1 Tax=Anguilla anguilla TaxID=7936 RepID=A0A0E9Q180_ANGAN
MYFPFWFLETILKSCTTVINCFIDEVLFIITVLSHVFFFFSNLFAQ